MFLDTDENMGLCLFMIKISQYNFKLLGEGNAIVKLVGPKLKESMPVGLEALMS